MLKTVKVENVNKFVVELRRFLNGANQITKQSALLKLNYLEENVLRGERVKITDEDMSIMSSALKDIAERQKYHDEQIANCPCCQTDDEDF
jgi:hypothetical protein